MNQARRAAREKWRRIIFSQRGSGQTVAAYCQARGIGQASFFAWKRRLRTSGPAQFVEVNSATKVMPPDASADHTGFIEVCLRGGRWLRVRRGVDRAFLIETIEVLEGLGSHREGLV
jgi:hypothetical protein